jgi:hypothetical protein
MHDITQIGYMPGYGLDSPLKFTRKFPIKIGVSVDDIRTVPDADFNVLLQSEPPNLYIKFCGMVQDNRDKFDLILTYDDRLLELPQATEFCAVGSWISDDIVLSKKNEISFLMSSKINGNAYHMRFKIMRLIEQQFKNNRINEFDVNWYRSPPRVSSKDPFFASAKFNVACENQIMTNMFTEKLLDCFKTYTVPIYYGCTNIEKYFNPKGIIRFNTIEEFTDIVNNLTPAVYDEMLPYLQENHELGRKYWEKNIYERIEDEIEKALDFNLWQTTDLLHTIILD